ncbi:MAG: hypothetical protein ACRBK7_29285 [Acidimicrobiales bacterium]
MTQDNWQEVKSKVEGLGLKLKLHLAQENDATDTTAKPGDTKAAVEELGEKLQEAFASFGTAAKDPAVRSDVKEIGALLKDAMATTLNQVSDNLSDRKTKPTDGRPDGRSADGRPDSTADGANDGASDS